MLKIRLFKPEDVGPVMDLVSTALRENYPPDIYLDIHRWWKEGFLIAENSGQVIGFMACVVNAPGQARVLMLAIDAPHRNQGIGTQLMTTFIRECAVRGMKSIELEVRHSNVAAIRFYKRHGFLISYSLDHFYTDGEDGYKMTKVIGAA